MLYPKNLSAAPDKALFKNPTAEYRATPFWAWNCDLQDELLLKEIDYMKEMGLGGFHMHVRTGMSTPYLSDAFMEHIRTCVDKAKKEDMLAWLYDEDRWPSGFAGGYVTEKLENRQKYLLLTPFAQAALQEGECLLARYCVRLDEAGCLAGYTRLAEDQAAEDGHLWYAYLKYTVPGPWFHFKGYVDTMRPKAIQDFIRITHERYRGTVGDAFGTVCPAIFTDEPQVSRKTELKSADALQDIVLSYTDDFDETFRACYGISLLDHLPEVVWELPDGASVVRYRYHDHATERFAAAYSDQIGAWCRKNGIMMTGHMMEEGSLRAQTRAVGECMRSYRGFDLPGIDMLCDGREYNTMKQCASAAHQQGAPGVLSELYGVTNWDFDFRGHKLQGDWQAALGVSVRVPHLYWASMHGESKRDYPASIGHQSSWYREYPFIEDHFARVNTLMTRGKPVIRIGVIHPIESYWINYGPTAQTGVRRKELEDRFLELTNTLLMNTLDFDFICESTLPGLYRANEQGFTVGQMRYDVVIIPGCDTLRATTVEALQAFVARGGRVLMLGDIPRYVDAVISDAPARLAGCCEHMQWSMAGLVRALAGERELSIAGTDGMPSDGLLYGMRQDGDCRNLFLCHAKPCNHLRVGEPETWQITLKGLWSVECWNTADGSVTALPCRHQGSRTVLTWHCYPQDSLLLRLSPATAQTAAAEAGHTAAAGSYGIRMAEELNLQTEKAADRLLGAPVSIQLHEDNVCLLDKAAWRIDDGEWAPEEEMLRLGIAAKHQLGMSTSTAAGAQPWILPPEKPAHTLTVRAQFYAEIGLDRIQLALEDIGEASIRFNGQPVPVADAGWYVDEAIRRVPLGPVHPGLNTVEVTRPFGTASCTENMFLLGRFGVSVRGTDMYLIPMPATLAYGDWTAQGLPFYGGPVTYRFTVTTPVSDKPVRLRLGLLAAPCAVAALDGRRLGNISLAPHEADLGCLTPGEHTLDITLYASRINTFGTFHLNKRDVIWFGPNAWRTSGMDWTYTYRLTPSGLLSEPHLYQGE